MISFLSFSAMAGEHYECSRFLPDNNFLFYHFAFSNPKKVTVAVMDSEKEIKPEGKSVPISTGRLVGLFNELTQQEELFMLPNELFHSDPYQKLKVEVRFRDGSVVDSECWPL
jgi:hypothetical protein